MNERQYRAAIWHPKQLTYTCPICQSNLSLSHYYNGTTALYFCYTCREYRQWAIRPIASEDASDE